MIRIRIIKSPYLFKLFKVICILSRTVYSFWIHYLFKRYVLKNIYIYIHSNYRTPKNRVYLSFWKSSTFSAIYFSIFYSKKKVKTLQWTHWQNFTLSSLIETEETNVLSLKSSEKELLQPMYIKKKTESNVLSGHEVVSFRSEMY